MAIVKFGGGVTGIRGDLGGNIFSANTNGAYARPWANIPNRRTLPQTIRRYYWSTMMPAWALIDPLVKADWKLYAKAHPQVNALGLPYYLTALQWFTRCNARLIGWGGSPVTDPPANPAPATIVPTSLVYQDNGGNDEIWVTFNEHDFDGYWIIIDAMVIPHGVSLTWPANYYRMRNDYEPYGTYWSFWLAHNAKFGLAKVGYQCFCRVYTGDNQGLVSPAWGASQVFATI